ncbi:MAG: M23 family metallopeptidase [Ignavibacteriaceae bacterium]
MKIFKLKKIKNYSIIVVPEETSSEPRSFKITSTKLISYFAIYSLFIFLLGFYIISYTPFNEMLLPYSLRLTDSDKKRVEILNEKLDVLANEIESLKSVNKRLKFAIMLGDSTLLKDLEVKKDSSTTTKKIQGNVYSIALKLITKIFSIQQNDVIFLSPVNGFVSREFNPAKGHYGNDYVLKENSPIYASASGYIVFSDYTTKFGNSLIINHQDNFVTKYLHCSLLIKKEGDFVSQGELIALSGNSGTESTGPHLHFEIWENGKPLNPEEVLIKF